MSLNLDSCVFESVTAMGIVCGMTSLTEEKEFDSIVSDPYEVRIYPSMVVAEVKSGENDMFMLLQYIGLLGIPENVKGVTTVFISSFYR